MDAAIEAAYHAIYDERASFDADVAFTIAARVARGGPLDA